MPAFALAPAASRNTAPILGVLAHELRDRTAILEIGSGTGQHAVAAASAFPALVWQPTDVADRIGDITALIEASGVTNVLEPRALDVHDGASPGRFDAVFTANTLHIVSEAGVRALLGIAGASLGDGGLLLCYGPFSRGGKFSTPSNAAFDASLRSGGGGSGVRDLERVDDGAAAAGLQRRRIYAMPANNLLLVFQKGFAGR